LVELMVAVAIMALVMTALLGTVQSTISARDEAEIEIASVRDGPRILDMIERDLRALHIYNLEKGAVLRGKRQSPGGLRGDRIDFLCTNDASRRLGDGAETVESGGDVAADINEVGYALRPSPLSNDFLELWRREDVFVDDEPFDGGTFEKIHDRVTRLEITYLTHLGAKADEETDWDMTEKKRLPGGVRIDLELQASPELVGGYTELAAEQQKLYRYKRVIAFGEEQTLALSVRPYLPVTITGRNDNAGANGGGGGGKDGKGGAGDFGTPENPGEMRDRGGSSLVDMMQDGNLPDGPKFDIDFSSRDGLQINLGGNGQLSPSDEAKLEEYLSDFSNRYKPSGGTGGRRGGGSGGAGGGSGGGGTSGSGKNPRG
jgi:hypothetical protein